MVISKRTKLSLYQFLGLFLHQTQYMLLEKHGISFDDSYAVGYRGYEPFLELESPLIESVIDEIARTSGDLRNEISPRYRFDERWSDLKKCLLLDGFKVEQNTVLKIDPSINLTEPVEDELISELKKSSLSLSDEVINHIKLSENTFRKSTPDYNACLSHSRIALETIIRGIAKDDGLSLAENENNKAWGKSLSFLKQRNHLTPKEESAIASAYTFISDGSHIPIGFTEEEFVRFGRNLTMSVCYFVIKQFNGN